MGGSLDKLVLTYQLQLQNHSFLPEWEVEKIAKKVDQISRKSARIAPFAGKSLRNGHTDLHSLPILPPFSKTGQWCQVEGKVTK